MTRFLQGAAFKLQDQTGTRHSLSDYEGKWVVLYLADLTQLMAAASQG